LISTGAADPARSPNVTAAPKGTQNWRIWPFVTAGSAPGHARTESATACLRPL